MDTEELREIEKRGKRKKEKKKNPGRGVQKSRKISGRIRRRRKRSERINIKKGCRRKT